LVVQESSQLLRKQGDGALGLLARLHPIVVDAPELPVRLQSLDGREGAYRIQHGTQVILALDRHEEIPEGFETPALVRIGYDVSLTKDVLEKLALGALPAGNALAGAAVQAPEVLLHLAEVGQQFAGPNDFLEPKTPSGVGYC